MQQSSSAPISFKAGSSKQRDRKPQRGTVRTHHRKTNNFMFNTGVGLDLRNKQQWRAQIQLAETERMSTIGGMVCSLSHDMRHSLSAIYANAEFLERHNLCANERGVLVLEIQEAVLEM